MKFEVRTLMTVTLNRCSTASRILSLLAPGRTRNSTWPAFSLAMVPFSVMIGASIRLSGLLISLLRKPRFNRLGGLTGHHEFPVIEHVVNVEPLERENFMRREIARRQQKLGVRFSGHDQRMLNSELDQRRLRRLGLGLRK